MMQGIIDDASASMALASSMMPCIMPITPPEAAFFSYDLKPGGGAWPAICFSVACFCKRVDGHCQVLNLGFQVSLVALLHLSVALVVVQFLNAEILVFDFVLLLLDQLVYHVLDGFFHLCEGIKASLNCKGGQTRILELLCCLGKNLGNL